MKRKIGCTLLLSVLMLIGVGCGQKPLTEAATTKVQSTTNSEVASPVDRVTASDSKSTSTDTTSDNKVSEVVVAPVESHKDSITTSQEKDTDQKEKILVYYTDPDAMELLKKEEEIRFTDDMEKYKLSFKALQNTSNPDLISLWSKMELKSMSFSKGLITLDVHMPDEARLGAGGEQFALDALKNTLFQFEEVKSIELLVDGEAVESLMGHADLEHPMVR